MKFKNIHLYSAHIKKGGANMACDSLFTALSKSKSNIIFSRSSYKKEGAIKYNLNRVLGKVVASTTCQSQFYRPFISNNSTPNSLQFFLKTSTCILDSLSEIPLLLSEVGTL